MTLPVVTTGTLLAGYALDNSSVTSAATSVSISVPNGSMLLVATGVQYANPGGPSLNAPVFGAGNVLTQRVISQASTVTHGDWNGGGFWSWQNGTGSAVTGTISISCTGATPQRLRMRAWVISGHNVSTPFQTVTASNVVNTSNGAADPALVPSTGTLSAQVDGLLFLLGLNFATNPASSSLGSVSDEYEMFQADSNYWISGYSAASSTGVLGTWTRSNTNGYKLLGLVVNPAVSGVPPTPSTPTISGVAVTTNSATVSLTLAADGRSSVSIRYGTDGVSWTTIVGTANQASFTISSLSPNTAYLVQARATNSAATVPDSAWSASTAFGTENPATGTVALSATPGSFTYDGRNSMATLFSLKLQGQTSAGVAIATKSVTIESDGTLRFTDSTGGLRTLPISRDLGRLLSEVFTGTGGYSATYPGLPEMPKRSNAGDGVRTDS